MNELTDFLNKLNSSNLIVLTGISEDQTDCRFFNDGVYIGRLDVTDPVLIKELQRLSGEGEAISAEGITKLKLLLLSE